MPGIQHQVEGLGLSQSPTATTSSPCKAGSELSHYCQYTGREEKEGSTPWKFITSCFPQGKAHFEAPLEGSRMVTELPMPQHRACLLLHLAMKLPGPESSYTCEVLLVMPSHAHYPSLKNITERLINHLAASHCELSKVG